MFLKHCCNVNQFISFTDSAHSFVLCWVWVHKGCFSPNLTLERFPRYLWICLWLFWIETCLIFKESPFYGQSTTHKLWSGPSILWGTPSATLSRASPLKMNGTFTLLQRITQLDVIISVYATESFPSFSSMLTQFLVLFTVGQHFWKKNSATAKMKMKKWKSVWKPQNQSFSRQVRADLS